jgi:hypothetical protein
MSRILGLLVATALLSGLTASAHATLITLSGATVAYTFDDSLLGLFGPASVAGDNLYFTPTAFKALSTSGAGAVTISQSLDVTVAAMPGFELDSLGVLERGDYLLYGLGTNTADVSGSFDLTATSNTINASLSSSAPLTITGLPTNNWDESLVLDVSGWGTSLDLALTSDLSASSSQSGGIGFVEQKYAGILATTNSVPEGNTLIMLLIGLGLIGHQLTKTSLRSSVTSQASVHSRSQLALKK